jgi:hypothetical protein
MDNEQDDLSTWVITASLLFLAVIVGSTVYFNESLSKEFKAKLKKAEEDRLSQPVVDLENGFIRVIRLGCLPITEIYSKSN